MLCFIVALRDVGRSGGATPLATRLAIRMLPDA